MLNGAGLAVNLILTVICCIGFCYSSDPISVATTGEHLKKSTWAIWLIGPFLIQLLLIRFLFHPLTFLILFGITVVMMIVTVWKTNDLEVLEEKADGTSNAEAEYVQIPTQRWRAWLFLAAAAMQSCFFAQCLLADLQPGGLWSLDHNGKVLKNILTWDLAPFLIAAIIGYIIAFLIEAQEITDEPTGNTVSES